MDLTERSPNKNIVTAMVLALSGHYVGYHFAIFNSLGGPILSGHFKMTDEDRIDTESNSTDCSVWRP